MSENGSKPIRNSLSEKERAVMWMRFDKNLTFKKIAENLLDGNGNKITEQMVRSAISKSCRKLKVGRTLSFHKEEVLAALEKDLLRPARDPSLGSLLAKPWTIINRDVLDKGLPSEGNILGKIMEMSAIAPSSDEIYKNLLDEASRCRSRYYASEYKYLLEEQT